MKIYRCMHDIEAMCNEHGRQLLLIWFINYLPLTKFHIVNPLWAISTLIISSCCTCHNYICNLFLNGILAGASVSYGHFSSLMILGNNEEQDQMTCHIQEWQLRLFLLLELSPLLVFEFDFLSLLCTLQNILMMLGTNVEQDEMTH